VEERGDKAALNTPGGVELEKLLGGSAGLPFFAFLDSHGGLIVNSIAPGQGGKKGENIGHPMQPSEIDWFLAMLHKGAPKMTPEETAAIEKWLRAQKKK
jgi:hypothetical protein